MARPRWRHAHLREMHGVRWDFSELISAGASPGGFTAEPRTQQVFATWEGETHGAVVLDFDPGRADPYEYTLLLAERDRVGWRELPSSTGGEWPWPPGVRPDGARHSPVSVTFTRAGGATAAATRELVRGC